MNKNAYIKRKIRKLLKEGMTQKQAVAIANSYWEKRKNKQEMHGKSYRNIITGYIKYP